MKNFVDSGLAAKLQTALLQRFQQKQQTSWLAEWWLDYAYLEYRDPICIWVNYEYVLNDEKYPFGSTTNTSRASRLIHSALNFKHLVET